MRRIHDPWWVLVETVLFFMIGALLVSLLFSITSCSSGKSKPPTPYLDPNPDGYPWGVPNPLDLNAKETIVVDGGRAGAWMVYTSGFPTGECRPPRADHPCIDLSLIVETIRRTYDKCQPGFPISVPIYVRPWLIRCGSGYTPACNFQNRIEVTGYYISWGGQHANYLGGLDHEIEHIWNCTAER